MFTHKILIVPEKEILQVLKSIQQFDLRVLVPVIWQECLVINQAKLLKPLALLKNKAKKTDGIDRFIHIF